MPPWLSMYPYDEMSAPAENVGIAAAAPPTLAAKASPQRIPPATASKAHQPAICIGCRLIGAANCRPAPREFDPAPRSVHRTATSMEDAVAGRSAHRHAMAGP